MTTGAIWLRSADATRRCGYRDPAVFAATPGTDFVVIGNRAYRTTGGGRHLDALGLPDHLSSFEAQGSSAYAISYPCPTNAGCRARLWHSFDAGRTWWYRTLPGSSSKAAEYLQIDAATSAEVLVNQDVHNEGGNELVHSRLLASHDGGHSWQQIRHPCRGFDKGTGVTSSDGRELWMSCHGSADTGSVYRSPDGGDHWSLTAAQPGADTARGSAGVDLEAIAPGVAVGSMRGGWLITTRDGGRHWADNGQLFVAGACP